MKKTMILSARKWTAAFIIVILLLSMVAVPAYANDELLPTHDGAPLTDTDEFPFFPGHYINSLCVAADINRPWGKASQYALEKAQYTCVYWNDGYRGNGRYADMNLGAGGYSIFLGYKYAPSFYDANGKMRSDLITGLLVYNGANPPKQFVFKGKTYKPIDTMEESNGDFNQNAGGCYLYLYYTNDGIERGDPVLTWIRARKPSMKTHETDYVERYDPSGIYDEPYNCICQDMNEKAGGEYIYLEASYHRHTLVDKVDQNGYTYKACTDCDFHTGPIDTHELHTGGTDAGNGCGITRTPGTPTVNTDCTMPPADVGVGDPYRKKH